jgi:hypothetical protein
MSLIKYQRTNGAPGGGTQFEYLCPTESSGRSVTSYAGCRCAKIRGGSREVSQRGTCSYIVARLRFRLEEINISLHIITFIKLRDKPETKLRN